MKLFITGGRGMVGKNIIALAEKKGIEVIAPSRQDLDLTSQAAINEYLSIHRPDVVVHCAGLVGGIQANIAAPYDFCFQNLQIGLNVIQASYDAGITRLYQLRQLMHVPKA